MNNSEDLELNFIAKQEEELIKIAEQIIDFAGDCKLMLLTGDLGTGKTTLVRAMCRHLEVITEISSPTFSLVNEYQTKLGHSVYHIDLYRLKSTDEAMHIGIEEYLYAGNWCFVEWPELIEEIVDYPYLKIALTEEDTTTRKIHILKLDSTAMGNE